MSHRQNTLRKAAVLVASLDEESARGLLAQMTTAQSDAVRSAMVELGEIDPAEQTEVIEEFFRIGPMLPERQPAGIELDSPLAERLGRAAAREQSGNSTTERRSGHRAPFQQLYEAAGSSLAVRLQQEHPQTIAVVVSHLPPRRAADLLASLPAALQSEVARRLIDLEESDPETLYEIERGLEDWLDDQTRSSRRRSAGMVALQNILDAADPNVHEKVIANLTRHDRALASQLAPAKSGVFQFSDFYELDDAALSKVFSHANHTSLTLALAGAGRALVSRAYRLLPAARAGRLRRDLERLGAVRVGEVDAAQQELVDVLNDLERHGELAASTGRKFSIAV